MADVVEVLQHSQAGGSERQLARSLGMGRNRVARIVAAAQSAGLSPGGPVMTRPEWEARVPDLFPDRVRRGVGDQERRGCRAPSATTYGTVGTASRPDIARTAGSARLSMAPADATPQRLLG